MIVDIEYDNSFSGKARSETWKQTQRDKVTDQVMTLSNRDLLDTFADAQSGDDWDGCFTDGGNIAAEVLEQVLYQRLVDVGFLDSVKEI